MACTATTYDFFLFPGAFLIPFSIMLVIAGLPLMFMELSFGQYAALGPVAVYNKFCPLFRGLGYGMVIVSTVVMLYYNLIIAWTIFYMFASLTTVLPWQNCEPSWSTQRKYLFFFYINSTQEALNKIISLNAYVILGDAVWSMFLRKKGVNRNVNAEIFDHLILQ